MTVEFFVTKDENGRIVIYFNEAAARAHNSFHHTEHACEISQFELHRRILRGIPIPDYIPLKDGVHHAVMSNVIGSDIDKYPNIHW